EASACFRHAVRFRPDSADFQAALGDALAAQHLWVEAIAPYERALALSPAFLGAQYCLAVARLHLHEFGQAWPGYEQRLQSSVIRGDIRKDVASVALYERLPHWQGPGEAVAGEVAIWAEQGIGDQVLYSTLIPELVAAGVPFVYEVDSRLL